MDACPDPTWRSAIGFRAAGVRRRVDGGAAKGANGEAARGNRTMIQRLKMGLVALVAALVATSAQAAPQRTPETGNPAVVVDVPDGWVLQRLSAITLNVLTPARNGLISITIETTPPGADLNLFRDNVFKSANCTSLNRAERVRIGGREAPAFYCQPSQTALAPARVILIRLGDTHVLALSHTYRLDATGADVQAVEKVLATTRYEGAP
jgi:hypothetical protein